MVSWNILRVVLGSLHCGLVYENYVSCMPYLPHLMCGQILSYFIESYYSFTNISISPMARLLTTLHEQLIKQAMYSTLETCIMFHFSLANVSSTMLEDSIWYLKSKYHKFGIARHLIWSFCDTSHIYQVNNIWIIVPMLFMSPSSSSRKPMKYSLTIKTHIFRLLFFDHNITCEYHNPLCL